MNFYRLITLLFEIFLIFGSPFSIAFFNFLEYKDVAVILFILLFPVLSFVLSFVLTLIAVFLFSFLEDDLINMLVKFTFHLGFLLWPIFSLIRIIFPYSDISLIIGNAIGPSIFSKASVFFWCIFFPLLVIYVFLLIEFRKLKNKGVI